MGTDRSGRLEGADNGKIANFDKRLERPSGGWAAGKHPQKNDGVIGAVD
jgi:hypothetical protein